MANFTLSPNMSLPVPTVGKDPGPDYASNLNASLGLLDAHDHSTGNGVKITPSGLNINSDLSIGGASLTNLLSAVFSSQVSALTGTNFLSFINGNLYVNDGSGNQIPITSGGTIAGTAGSIGGLTPPAAATYSAGSKLFLWTSDSLKAAAMDNGAVTIRETDVASAKGVTLLSPTGLAADYNLTLPSGLPGTNPQYLTSNTSGVLSFSTADNIGSAMGATGADAIGSSMTSTGANAVVADVTAWTPTATVSNSIANARTMVVTTDGTDPGLGGICLSQDISSFSKVGTGTVGVTNMTCDLTTSGRPVEISINADGAVGGSYIAAGNTTTGSGILSGIATITLQRAIGGGAYASVAVFKLFWVNYSSASVVDTAAAVLQPGKIFTDVVSSGLIHYKVQVANSIANAQCSFQNLRLQAQEL